MKKQTIPDLASKSFMFTILGIFHVYYTTNISCLLNYEYFMFTILRIFHVYYILKRIYYHLYYKDSYKSHPEGSSHQYIFYNSLHDLNM